MLLAYLRSDRQKEGHIGAMLELFSEPLHWACVQFSHENYYSSDWPKVATFWGGAGVFWLSAASWSGQARQW